MKRTSLILVGFLLMAGCSSSEEASNTGGAAGSGGADAGGSGGADASAGSGGSTGGTGGSTGGSGGSAGQAGSGGGGAAGQAGSGGTGGTAGAAGIGGSGGTGGSSGTAGSSGAAGASGSGGSVDAGPDGAAGAAPDAAEASGPEICDDVDNDQNGQIDEGCDDDGDDYCDANMVFAGSAAVCPNGGYDCNDDVATIHPDSTTHVEGADYDCDGKLEYMATIVISVDDLLTRLCVNGVDVTPFGPNAGQWPYADTYQVVMESGDNVVGVSGRDTGLNISAFVATIQVNGTTYITDGVNPPANGIAYTASDPEWNQTAWRYYPTEVGTPDVTWCDVAFDDSGWGPAIIAKSVNCAADPELGDIGHCPWHFHDCGGGETRCPSDFIPYYEDGVADNEPVWVWDYNPVNLADAWFRHHITLP